MIEPIRNLIQREVRLALSAVGLPRIGTVDSYNPAKHAAKVLFQDEGSLSGWLPIAQPWTGNGWGLHAAPAIGAQVVVNYHDGDINAGFISHALYSTADQPLSVPTGELWLQHANGLTIRLQGNGQIEIGASGSAMHALLTDAFQTLFNTHTHGGVQPGAGHTAVPDQQSTSAQLTAHVQAN